MHWCNVIMLMCSWVFEDSDRWAHLWLELCQQWYLRTIKYWDQVGSGLSRPLQYAPWLPQLSAGRRSRGWLEWVPLVHSAGRGLYALLSLSLQCDLHSKAVLVKLFTARFTHVTWGFHIKFRINAFSLSKLNWISTECHFYHIYEPGSCCGMLRQMQSLMLREIIQEIPRTR